MMKIPDEFMQTDIQYQQREEQNEEETKEIQRRGSVDITTAFKPARRREIRRQRPQRHTTAVTPSDVPPTAALFSLTASQQAMSSVVSRGESKDGGLNRTLHHCHHQPQAGISRWSSLAKISFSANNLQRRGSSKADNSDLDSEPLTAFETANNSIIVRALSPLLTPAVTMAQKAAVKMSLMSNETNFNSEQVSSPDEANAVGGQQQELLTPHDLPTMTQAEFEEQYDIVQKIGEGWYSRVYLTEHRATRHELVLKAVNNKNMSIDEFLREFHHSLLLGTHANILTIFPNIVFNLEGQCCMFASEYAPLGDLTSNINDVGIGESNSKRVARQIGSALDWMHSKNLCHLDVKLDNILVFRSDFSRVKLCDFGSVKSQGDIVIKKNELLPYCPPELVAKHANEYYQVDRVQDVFQFGIVIFFCLFGILPWQRADPCSDPNFAEFSAWRRKRTSKVPKNFKPMSGRGQKFFKKLLDPDPEKRLKLGELPKLTGDELRWLRRPGGSKSLVSSPTSDPMRDPASASAHFLSDGISQLTMGSFQSVHSNAVEKKKALSTLLQHGLEATVDRSQKTSRILNWIQNGRTTDPAEQLELQSRYRSKKSGSLSSSGVGSDDPTPNSQHQSSSVQDNDVDSGHYHQ